MKTDTHPMTRRSCSWHSNSARHRRTLKILKRTPNWQMHFQNLQTPSHSKLIVNCSRNSAGHICSNVMSLRPQFVQDVGPVNRLRIAANALLDRLRRTARGGRRR